MIGTLRTVVLDAPDVRRLAAFYAALGGWTGNLSVTSGQPDTPAHLRRGRSTRYAYRLLSNRSPTQPLGAARHAYRSCVPVG
jgi:hypothetical protein